ncbi:MAG TPA: cysteine rich repeat-containing protein [Desulfuromonadales bacterium]
MKRMSLAVFSVLLVLFASVQAFAAEDPVKKAAKAAMETFVQGCETEITTYCKDVSPGEGRILACLFAFQDKLSPKCEYALYDSASQLDRALNAITYAVNECRDDLKSYCADIKPGEGRLRDCLEKNEEKVSARCKTAIKEIDLK